jgi:hypothetical protein
MPADRSDHYLQPWSVISDTELARLRKLETIAKWRIRHILQDPNVTGLSYDSAQASYDDRFNFSRAELEWLIR